MKFSLTSKVTAPFPLPAFDDVITIQLSALVADQAQLTGVVVKLALPDPPLAEKNWLVGEVAKLQAVGIIWMMRATEGTPLLFKINIM